MKDKIILLVIYYSYLLIPKRENFFLFIYSGLIISNIFKMLNFLLFFKVKFGKKIVTLIKYFIYYMISYFLIKDPNPFYYLITFYLPLPNLFRAIFIVVFISFLFNNKIYNQESEEKKNDSKKKEEKIKDKIKDDIKEIEIKKIYPFFLSEYIKYFYNNKKKFLLFLIVLIIIKILMYFYSIKFWIYFTPKEKILSSDIENNTKYFICSTICNMEPIIVDWIAQMKLLIDYLGKENIYISILENGDSKDNTRTFLKDFQQYLNENSIPNKIILDHIIKRTNKERIVYLAQLRDLSLQYLYQIDDLDFSNTKIIFFNDIIFRFQDIVKLIGTNNGDYDSVCAFDFYEGFYDSWASQLLDGQYFRRYFPYMGNKEAQDAVINGELIRTFSCWNGVTVFSAKPFEDEVLFFRHGYKIRQSECLLIHSDMYFMGFQKTIANPNIAVAYTYEYYYKNHYLYPWTKNLFSYFYYYFRYGLFKKRFYSMTNIKDRSAEINPEFEYLLNIYFTK